MINTFPILHTGRLLLRKIDVDDVPSLVKYANNKKISDFVLNIPYPYQEPDGVFRISYVWQGFKSKARYVFAIILKEREELVGEIGIHLDNNGKVAQLGYWVGEPFWGQGIATEAVAVILKFGFERLQLDTVYATCHASNGASGRVLEKNDMLKIKTESNIVQYTLSAEEYKTRQGRLHND